jgi:hypothetical protein
LLRVVVIDPKDAVLGKPAFGDIQVGQHFDPRDDRIGHILQLFVEPVDIDFFANAVGAVAQPGTLPILFDVDIAGAFADAQSDDEIDDLLGHHVVGPGRLLLELVLLHVELDELHVLDAVNGPVDPVGPDDR